MEEKIPGETTGVFSWTQEGDDAA